MIFIFKIMHRTYKNKLHSDIKRVLALPRNNGYEKAIRPMIMECFYRWLNGEVKHFKKKDLWNALSEIGKLYGMMINYNPYTKFAYFHVQMAPCLFTPGKPGVTTYYGRYPAKEAEKKFFWCIVDTQRTFTGRYKDVSEFQKAIANLRLKTGL